MIWVLVILISLWTAFVFLPDRILISMAIYCLMKCLDSPYNTDKEVEDLNRLLIEIKQLEGLER